MNDRKVSPNPPIGIQTADAWNRKCRMDRAYDIIAAIRRYNAAGMNIPGEWLTELEAMCGGVW